MARGLFRVFRIFAVELIIIWIMPLHGCVVKCGRVSFFIVLAHFGRFGGLSSESGPTDHPASEMPVKRKFGKNNRSAGQWLFGNPE